MLRYDLPCFNTVSQTLVVIFVFMSLEPPPTLDKSMLLPSLDCKMPLAPLV